MGMGRRIPGDGSHPAPLSKLEEEDEEEEASPCPVADTSALCPPQCPSEGWGHHGGRAELLLAGKGSCQGRELLSNKSYVFGC